MIQNTTLQQGLELDIAFNEGAIRPGTDKVTNGGFDTDTDWLKEEGTITISGGVARFSGTTVNYSIYQLNVFEVDKYYIVSYQVSGYVAGGIQLASGVGLGVTRTANGTYTEIFASPSTPLYLSAKNAATTLDIDNVVVREIDQSTYDRLTGNSVTLSNVVPTTDVKGNGQKYYEFDGSSTQIAAFNPTTLIGDEGDFSLLVKLKPNAVDTNDMILGIAGTPRFYFRTIALNGIGLGDAAITLTDFSLDLDTWQYIVYVITSSTIKVYKDGVEITNVSNTSDMDMPNADVYIGSEGGSKYFDGDISKIQLFNYALSSSEVSAYSQDNAHLSATDKGADNSEEISSWTNSDFDSFTSSGVDITQMVSGANGDNCYSACTLIAGKRYRISFTASQALATCRLQLSSANNLIPDFQIVLSSLSSGANSIEFTATYNSTFIGFKATASFTDTQISDWTFVELGNTLNIHPEGYYPNLIIDHDHATTIDVSGPTLYEDSFNGALKFNGTDSYGLLADANWDGTGGKLICFWMYPQSLGESDLGIIINDNKLIIWLRNGDYIQMYREGVTGATSLGSSIDQNAWNFVGIIAPSDGLANQFWIGGETTTPTDQTNNANSSTPVDGTDLYIGNNSSGIYTFEGAIQGLRIWDLDKIHGSPQDLLQLYYSIYQP